MLLDVSLYSDPSQHEFSCIFHVFSFSRLPWFPCGTPGANRCHVKSTEDLLLSEPNRICIVARLSMNGSCRFASLTKESPVVDFTPG